MSGNKSAWYKLYPMLKAGWEKDVVSPTVQAVYALVQATFPNDPDLYSQAAFVQQVHTLKQQLEGEHPTPLEALLAQHIAVCWLSRYLAEMTCAAHQKSAVPLAEFHEKRVMKASQRLTKAIETLAQVRRLQALTPLRAPIALPVAERPKAQPNVTKAG